MRPIWLVLLFACEREPPPGPGPGPEPESERLVINEVMSDNRGAWTDPEGDGCPEADDWIELYNPGDEAVSTRGLRVEDDADGVDGLALPELDVPPGGFLLLAADGDPSQGPLHTPFKLSAEGELLTLRDAAGEVVDQVSFPPLLGSQSWGRLGDGKQEMGVQPAPTPGAANQPPPDDPCLAAPVAFEDHGRACFSSREGFFSFSRARAGLRTVKFDILAFPDPARRRVLFLDSAFYDLHDEWYLFRMLNGQPVEGEDLYTPFDGSFATIDDIYAWASTIDLAATFDSAFIRWAGARLTSGRFYELALAIEPRPLGVGVLTYIPAWDASGAWPERWGFELEYSDDIDHASLSVYFDALEEVLPEEITRDLRWLVRSPVQEALAQQMETQGLKWADRITRYDEIAPPGAASVYQAGVAAGRVRVVREGEAMPAATSADDLLVLAQVPDELPAGSALLTGVPQTPLSHVSLLAASRGIPNAFVDGITTDPAWDQWGRVRAWVALFAGADDSVTARAMSNSEIATWSRLRQPVTPVLEVPDLAGVPWTMSLDGLTVADMPSLRPILGGKSAGMLALLGRPEVDTPDHPLGITVAAYAAHLASLDWLPALLTDVVFTGADYVRQRYLVLEGAEAYRLRYGRPADLQVLADFDLLHPPGDRLGDLARGGGLRGAVRDAPAPAGLMEAITAAVSAQFAALAPAQGLRFRSSSNVEDADGFNGAGLYASYSGWIDPTAAGEDPGATVEAAVREVWGSYWGAEAFEERLGAGLRHLDGRMGVLVHPRFEDEAELANGVLTLTRNPDGHADRWELVVNAQVGAVSVTNPPPPDDCRVILPEVSRLRVAAGGGAPRIERVSRSTETAGEVLSDAELIALWQSLHPVVDAWIEAENAELTAAQARSTLVLDSEVRKVADGWPAMADGSIRPSRMVVKQARTLEPSTAALPVEVIEGPFPRDLVARAAQVDARACVADRLTVRIDDLRSDPLLTPDMGFATSPFVGAVTVEVTADIPELGWRAGDAWSADHLVWVSAALTPTPGALTLALDVADGPLAGTIGLAEGGAWQVSLVSGATAVGGAGSCAVETRYAAPERWLRGLFP
jgi:hypothetical protein